MTDAASSKEVAVQTESGRWHRAFQDQDSGVLSSAEGCNLDDAIIELYPVLPSWVLKRDLCRRCKPKAAE